ncbi:alpha/beta fold hydrolase [Variovorax paradoxus]|uniref:alpha/beta fold hydrolase n=1 Tax=Variovorax paradoxus TaxID=34073 RepID=UPI003ECF5663
MEQQIENPEIGQHVVAAGIQTNYLDQGSGEPLVMLHGSGPGVTAWANWRLVIPAFAQNYRVVAPDLAGFGYTERKQGVTYNLDFWTEHLSDFLRVLGIKSCHLIGNSFGGALSLALAVRNPGLVNRLVLMGSVGTHFELTPGLDKVWGYEPSLENMRETAASFAYDKSLITEALVKSRFDASVRPGFQESYAALFPAPRQKHIAALAQPDDVLRKLPNRVLLVHGRDDKIIPMASTMKLHELIPQSEVHLFGGCGHWTQIEKKDRFISVVQDFLSAA